MGFIWIAYYCLFLLCEPPTVNGCRAVSKSNKQLQYVTVLSWHFKIIEHECKNIWMYLDYECIIQVLHFFWILLFQILCLLDSPRVSDPNISLVAREIMQRMIRQFAAEYTSKTSSTQDSSSPNSTKNQSLLKASPVASSTAGARAQNPVLSKLLMADQDSPLDLTVRKSQLDPSEQGMHDTSLSIFCGWLQYVNHELLNE